MKDKSDHSIKGHPPLMEPDEALAQVLAHTPGPVQSECSLLEAMGRILAEPVCADRDYPPFDRAMMDGVAARVADAGKTVRVIGEVAAGQASDIEVLPGTCVDIMTGAVCPSGTEVVVKKEDLERTETSVTLPAPLKENKNISARGSDCAEGSTALEAGDVLTPLAIGMLASFGYENVPVYKTPRLAVIATGREVIPPGTKPELFQIRDANGPLLLAMAQGLAGLVDLQCTLAEDTPESINDALRRAADCDIILLSGGVSAGKYDIVPDCIREFGAEVRFHKVRQKPGKPLLFATKNDQLIFGLPGNPLAVHMCFHRYVASSIRKMTGKPAPPLELKGTLTGQLVPKGGRDRFELVHVSWTKDGWQIAPRKTVSSADIFNASQANGYVRVPAGAGTLETGQIVDFFVIGDWRWTS